MLTREDEFDTALSRYKRAMKRQGIAAASTAGINRRRMEELLPFMDQKRKDKFKKATTP